MTDDSKNKSETASGTDHRHFPKNQNEPPLEIIDDGLIQLLSVLEPEYNNAPAVSSEHSALLEACRLVARDLNFTVSEHQTEKMAGLPTEALLEKIAEASQFRIRPMTLTPEWWQNDCGPLLCFMKETGQPMAILRREGHYFWVDEGASIGEPLTPTLRDQLNPTAYRFYRTFENIALDWKALFKFVWPNLSFDFRKILLLQAMIGLLALFLPIFTGIIFDNLIPSADLKHLLQTIIALVFITFISTVFGMVEGLLLLKIRLKSTVSQQAALWDRILRLPLSFFRKYNAGDLTLRSDAIETVQDHITQSSVVILLSGTFSIFSLFLMFYYDIYLALFTLAMSIIAVLATTVFGVVQLSYQRPLMALQGKISGILYQLLTCIHKIRISNSERNAFGLWSKNFSDKNKLSLKVQMNIMWFEILYPLFFVLVIGIIYYMVVARGKNLSFGHFIAFNAAFGQFFAALLSMAAVITRSIEIIPLFERMTPILTTLPETENTGIEFEQLSHPITIHDVSFRYLPESSWTIENLSLTIPKGSFIGLVGQSGSGKSTLLRLLLGFEHSIKGFISYNGHELSLLNIHSLRARLGVVLQTSTLLPGTIYENITGLHPSLTLEDAWNAARAMEIAEDIQAMPMGMQSFIAENGKNISVGQKQRIMLARAIIRKPEILLLDEATTALDNITQMKISDNLAKMNITRIVAAHRLNLVKSADCIYVLDSGQILQQGRYSELLNQPGLFEALSKRQLL